MVRKRLTFWGRVQGVGFRYKAYYLAFARGLTGWVHNDWDGSVSMEVQGQEAKIDELILALESDRFILISNMKEKILPVDENERSFRIRGY